MLSERHRAEVRDTWALVRPTRQAAATLFYDRLFDLDPSLQDLFARADMASQGEKLMTMLDVAVAQLDRLDTLGPAVAAMGARHARYGVRDAHYATVGAALLWTLAQGLGPRFTPDAQEAWATTYAVLVEAMREGARLATA